MCYGTAHLALNGVDLALHVQTEIVLYIELALYGLTGISWLNRHCIAKLTSYGLTGIV